jgi:hypothetical protein
MRSSTIVALFNRSPGLLAIALLSGLWPVTTSAESAQLRSMNPVQTAATAVPHTGTGASTGV